MRKTTHRAPGAPMPLRPEDQVLPVIEAYEGLLGGRAVATVSLTVDRQTWIAGIEEVGGNVHVGSFPSIDEAKSAVTERLGVSSKPILWIRRELPGKPD
jgi:hypothetical protein